MIKIIYKQDPLSENKTIEHAETIGLWLTSKYEYMPEHVRIFHTTSNMDNAEISFANEVTPKNAYELKQLDFLPGTFIVIENPKGIPALVAAIVSIVLSVAVALLMPTPSIAQTNQNNNQSSSANNELSNRENKIRVNGRIADIYGAAHDTPDLIAVPYKVYENNVEVEHVVGCIGRGHYKINGAYDGETN
ncbi:phage tail protein, partial [Acinetobacter baumannii]|nr:phage tail protein [Acinetobacter baumannii]